MGNVADKSKGQGYYGVSREGIYCEESPDGFLIIKVNLDPAPENTYEEETSNGRRSPFEQVTTCTCTTSIAKSTEDARDDLEGSIDSGYAETQAAAHTRGASPEPIPVPNYDQQKNIQDQANFSGEPTHNLLIEQDCRTARSLGKHHAYFGYRFFHYDDIGCEGNKHILNDEL